MTIFTGNLIFILLLLYSSVDDYFEEAQTYWERKINTLKDSQVASSRWRDYKVILITF